MPYCLCFLDHERSAALCTFFSFENTCTMDNATGNLIIIFSVVAAIGGLPANPSTGKKIKPFTYHSMGRTEPS